LTIRKLNVAFSFIILNCPVAGNSAIYSFKKKTVPEPGNFRLWEKFPSDLPLPRNKIGNFPETSIALELGWLPGSRRPGFFLLSFASYTGGYKEMSSILADQ
jgi:hypothetical protein